MELSTTLSFTKTHHIPTPTPSTIHSHTHLSTISIRFAKTDNVVEEVHKFKWVELEPTTITKAQKKEIAKLAGKMSNRCKAFMKQIICRGENGNENELRGLLKSWVNSMKPRRNDWLVVLKEMRRLEHPLLCEVTRFALLEESFEGNTRDYTKLIDRYAKKSQLQDAENTVQDMKIRGFTPDQVTLTVLVNMYSKAGNLSRAEETFDEIKLLGLPLDKRSYGAMIMAYIRAGMNEQGEILLREMEAQQIYAGREVYKALLRTYSIEGDANGAQRVFDLIQFAGIVPDAKICALLMNAYMVVDDCEAVHIVFENLRSAGLEPSDKCIAIMMTVYEKENRLNLALELLMDLEKNGIVVSREASEVLAKWFRRIGVVEEVELVLKEFAIKECTEPAM